MIGRAARWNVGQLPQGRFTALVAGGHALDSASAEDETSVNGAGLGQARMEYGLGYIGLGWMGIALGKL